MENKVNEKILSLTVDDIKFYCDGDFFEARTFQLINDLELKMWMSNDNTSTNFTITQKLSKDRFTCYTVKYDISESAINHLENLSNEYKKKLDVSVTKKFIEME